MVPARQAVQLLVSEKMILEETLGKLRMSKAVGHGDERDKRCTKMVNAILIVRLSLLSTGREWCRDDCDVVLGGRAECQSS